MNPLFKNLTIRSAIVRDPKIGYIYACDIQKEKKGIPHAITFKWHDGNFTKGVCNYNAQSLCFIQHPEFALVNISGSGEYTAVTKNGNISGDIFESSRDTSKKLRTGGFRFLAEIDGYAYAVGLRGMVYKLKNPKEWVCLDEQLPQSFDIQAVHGFSETEIYTVGRDCELWQYENRKWIQHQLPFKNTLTAVRCAEDGNVYLAGHKGLLIRGRNSNWEIIQHGGTEEDIWDLEWFQGRLYVSTMRNVYFLDGQKLLKANFANDPPKTCYQLSSTHDVMWSNGEFDLMSFDGKEWTRIV